MAIGSELIVEREYSEICSVIVEVNKIWEYYSRVIVKDLRNERSVRLIIGFSSATESNFNKIMDSLIMT